MTCAEGIWNLRLWVDLRACMIHFDAVVVTALNGVEPKVRGLTVLSIACMQVTIEPYL